jgi:predicted peptidase
MKEAGIMKRIITFLLTLSLLAACGVTAFASGEASASGGPSGGMGSMEMNSDEELAAMIEEVAPKFTVEEYTDEATGLTVEYNVFLPEDYDGKTEYPMVVFIPDSSVVGRGAEAVLTQGWGALIWATEAEQAKHPAIVIAPVFTTVILDDHNGFVTTDYVDMVPRMVEALAEKYNADTDRLYATGQSMGCMTMLIAASTDTDLFAAELFVDGQWDITTLRGLESQTFFYIAAGGDQKAVGGQDEVLAMLDEDKVPYSYAEGWDAQADAGELTALVEAELAEGNAINFIRWEPGTVLNGGSGMEHMASFDYAYKLEAVRDWLFEQSK